LLRDPGHQMAAGVDGAAAGVLQLAVFDDRRSVADGDDPADQLLAYYPERVGPEDRAGAIGLMRAVMAFTSIFTEVQWRTRSEEHRIMHSGHLCNIPVTDPRAWALGKSCATQDAADEVAMDAQQHHWVSYAAEPHVYLLLVGVAGTLWLLLRAWCRRNGFTCYCNAV
jgi:hypothetical protein